MAPRDVLKSLAVTHLDGSPTLDWSDLTWVTPAHMAGCAALAKRFTAEGREFTVVAPRSDDVSGYLARMRFGRTLSELGVRHKVPTSYHAADRHNDLLELSLVATDSDAERLAKLVEANVRSFDPEMALRLFMSLGEVGGNVADHAKTDGFVAAQKFPARNALHLAVADGGVGFRYWLSETRGAASDAEALSMVLEGVSRHTEESECGGGVARTLRLVSGMRGSALLASGDAWSQDRGDSRKRGSTMYAFSGTLFHAIVPLTPRRLS